MDPDPLDPDALIRDNLAQLGEPALRALRNVLTAPKPYRDSVSRALIARPASIDLAQLLAMCERDPVAKMRVLWAIRDLGVE